MALTPRAMSRPRMLSRPWLTNTCWDVLNSTRVLHADIRAYYPKHSFAVYFTIEYRISGRVLVATDCMEARGDALILLQEVPALADMAEMYWDKATHVSFRRAHRALVDRALSAGDVVPGITRVSVHCHYVRVLDVTPWPRGFVNAKLPPLSTEVPRRKRRTKLEMEAARALAVGRLPDWKL